MKEKTFVIFKPDCMEKKLEAEVLARFIDSGLEIVACKMARLEEKVLREHYAHIADKPFYPPLAAFMGRTPVIMAVFQGIDAVHKVRRLLGPTDSQKAPAGTIRGDFGDNTRENIAHASDSIESAEKEIARFFSQSEIFG